MGQLISHRAHKVRREKSKKLCDLCGPCERRDKCKTPIILSKFSCRKRDQDDCMIFIAGISPKTKKLDENPRRCPICGLHQAYFKRVDHYLSLFFIPLLRVKKGDPFIMCDRCEKAIPDFGPDFSQQTDFKTKTCPYCKSSLDQDFKYCPYCGKQIH